MDDNIIDDRFYEIGCKIASLDPVKEDIKSLSLKFQSFQNDLYKYIEREKNDHLEIEKKISSVLFNHNKLESLVEIRNRVFCEYLEENKSLKSEFKEIKENGLDVEQQINSLKKELDVVSALSRGISDHLSSQSKEIKSLKENYGSLKNDFLFLKNRLNEINLYNGQLYTKLNELSDKLHKEIQFREEKEKKDSKYINDFATKICSHIEEVKRFTDKRVSELVIPKTDDFSSKKDIEDLKLKLEEILLDAKNASLKASNVEIQNQIQGKKIENIQLTLKNAELNR